MFQLFIGLVFLAVVVQSTSVANGGPVVTIPLGSVMGHRIKSYEGRPATAFEGIPYAKSPEGKLRFQAPQPIEAWSNTLVANKTYICPQMALNKPIGKENCLYLYIYVPRETVNGTENLDVVVRIHDGDFMTGSPQDTEGPEYLLDKDLVLVNFNYRIGALGFLSTNDSVVPGNNGLKDQVCALKWIKDHIKSFGGNPNSITITGASAGAVSVHLHYLSPMSKGLFHRGFSQSGTALNPSSLNEKTADDVNVLASQLKCGKNSSQAIVDCFRSKPAVMFTDDPNDELDLRFAPVIEKFGNSFLPDHPYKLLVDRKINDLPWIASNVKDEAVDDVRELVLHKVDQEMDKHWTELASILLDYSDTVADEKTRKMIAQKVHEKYFNNLSISSNLDKFAQVLTDRLFLVDTDTALRQQFKASKSNIYYCAFEYSLGMQEVWKDIVPGVANGDDASLLYRNSHSPKILSTVDQQMKTIFIDFLHAYATTGIPKFNGVEWKPIKAEGIDYMHIGSPTDIKMQMKKELAPKDFWNSLPIMENQHLYKQ